ncbi:MAG: protein kinase domain-containing protein [Pyrinomonadaceae bacterium]
MNFVKELGLGGFGKIILLEEETTKRKIVQKSLINPCPENCERLIREGRIYQQLKDNPFIIDIIGGSFDKNNPVLLLPYYEKGTLQNWVGRTHWYRTLAAVQNIAGALEAVHNLGGFHRDIKPSNLFVDEINGSTIIKLGDFGIGRLPQPIIDRDITRHACGTDGYIAPELYLKNAQFTSACDIYSLGITGIESITGSRNPNSIVNSWINNDVKHLLLKMTNSNPDLRPSAHEIKNKARFILENHNKNVNTGLTILGATLLGLIIWDSN